MTLSWSKDEFYEWNFVFSIWSSLSPSLTRSIKQLIERNIRLIIKVQSKRFLWEFINWQIKCHFACLLVRRNRISDQNWCEYMKLFEMTTLLICNMQILKYFSNIIYWRVPICEILFFIWTSKILSWSKPSLIFCATQK